MKTILITAILAIFGFAQTAVFDALPKPMQLFPRDNDDSVTVTVSGKIRVPSKDSVSLVLKRDSILVSRQVVKLVYADLLAPFSFQVRLCAGLFLYSFQLFADTDLSLIHI